MRTKMEENYTEDDCDCCCPCQTIADILKDNKDAQQSAEDEIDHLITTRATLRDRADNWQACAADLTEQLGDRKEYIDTLHEKMHMLERAVTYLEGEEKRSLHLIAKQHDDIKEQRDTAEKWESAARHLSRQLSARHNDIVNLLRRVHDTEDELADSEYEVHKLTAQIRSAEKSPEHPTRAVMADAVASGSPYMIRVPRTHPMDMVD